MRKHRIAIVVITLLLGGCPTDAKRSGPVDTCEKAGQQCRIGGGKLGVCSMNASGELFCMSQH